MTDLFFSATKACLIAGFYPILIFALQPSKKVSMIVCLVLFVFLAIALRSRMAIAGIILSTGLWLDIRPDRRTWLAASVLFIVLILVNIDSCYGRLFIWYNILSHIQEIPLLGNGAEMFQSTYANWQAAYFSGHTLFNKAFFVADSPMFAYNEWLQLYVEFGIGATILLAVLVFLNVVVYKKTDRKCKGIVVSNLVLLGFCLASFPLHQSYTTALFFVNHLILLTILLKNRIYKKVGFGLIACIGVVFIYREWNKERQLRKWKSVSAIPFLEKRTILDECRPTLCNDPYFLDNYISVLLLERDFSEAGNALVKYRPFMNQFRYYMLSGDRYNYMQLMDSAILHYRQAHFIIPNRYEPLHKIMILQLLSKDVEGAQLTAAIIEQMPVKVQSPQINVFKKDAGMVLQGRMPSAFN